MGGLSDRAAIPQGALRCYGRMSMGTVVQMGPTAFHSELWPHWKSPSVVFPASVHTRRIHCSLFFHQAQVFCVLLPVYETKRSMWF